MIEHRLDVILKYLYFRSLISEVSDYRIEWMYRRHINARTGGKEPASRFSAVQKNSTDDYVLAARQLLASMERRGFDETHPIPIGANNLPLNGSHRLACALALDVVPQFERVDDPGLPWNFSWFASNGFTKPEQLRLLEGVVSLLPAVAIPFIMWAPAIDSWDEMTQEINQIFPVAGHVDLAFPASNRPAYESLIYDVYSHDVDDFRHGFDHIHRKLSFLAPYPSFLRVGCAIVPMELAGQYGSIVEHLKKTLRQKYSSKIAADKFITLHIADSPNEARHMAATLFNPDNLHWAKYRTSARPRDFLLDALTTYKSTLKSLQIDGEDAVIAGSGILEPLGVRLTTDIDFTIPNDLRARRFGPGVTQFGNGVDLVTENYHRKSGGTTFTDSEILTHPGLHIRYLGQKFVAPWIVRDRKNFSGRPKDRLDVELIDQHFSDLMGHASPWLRRKQPSDALHRSKRTAARPPSPWPDRSSFPPALPEQLIGSAHLHHLAIGDDDRIAQLGNAE